MLDPEVLDDREADLFDGAVAITAGGLRARREAARRWLAGGEVGYNENDELVLGMPGGGEVMLGKGESGAE